MFSHIFLTFDCEDFVNDRSISALYHVLKLLHAYNIKGLFFLTGHMAEKITHFPRILDLLEDEEIGYHSSAHSVRPIIIEYTDVENYAIARHLSSMRETHHINPITGELKGTGGITFLRSLFPKKRIVAFRAPGFSYSPPHLEALKELGVRFDFSANLSSRPINFKGITFYPYPILVDVAHLCHWHQFARVVLKYLSKFSRCVLVFHPQYFVNAAHWDSMYFSGNPKRLRSVQARTQTETRLFLKKFELLLKQIGYFESKKLFDITPKLERGEIKTSIDRQIVVRNYRKSVTYAKKYFGYKSRFIFNHYIDYFNISQVI